MNKRATLIAFAAALLVQVLILAGVPARKIITLATGKSATLKVEPVDPYSILSGYYVTLGYEISRPENFPNPGQLSDGDWVYALIERGEDGIWKPVSLERELPVNLSDNHATLLGRVRYGRIQYGIEEFYIPETQRDTIAEDLRENMNIRQDLEGNTTIVEDNSRGNTNKVRVEIKIDSGGHAALERLRIEDRVYE